MTRMGYQEEHEAFRRTVRSFLDREHEPNLAHYEKIGGLDRDFWRKAGAAGLLGLAHTGGGDFTYYAIAAEELGRSAGSATTGSSLMADVATYILIGHGTDAQKEKYLPGILTGEWTQAMPLTEPGVGSDATAITATARREGDAYVINGEKYFISNGAGANLLYVVAKTDPSRGAKGMSVIIVEADTPGVSQAKIPMIGWRQGDTGAVNFADVRVPVSNLVGQEGGAMKILMATFLEDRIQIAARCLGAASRALELTLDYVKQRKVFGQRVIDFQNTQFVLADCRADIRITETMVDTAMMRLREKQFTFEDGAILKLWATQMEGRVLDRCVQLFGGAGLMDENPIARMWTAARIQRIYAGTDELQKVAIARGML
ncbi:acyl-CoA dehydrogenase family protein [Sandaracinobacter sp. RS1-74]|uniref:acyl-CoA dehydrogenase family protein n=1 Tax=Sandaracinobacteroides sayramensis TaxID=2913411 RepID=UPI001EDB6143|nr:acyl-CoA dehydrogenase family protein [Sandaracinobacteroides sayramensis]MCG2840956.1 acyl-CoA dehydrogenase family protein [Sandaracinobacteroides sayramensis]